MAVVNGINASQNVGVINSGRFTPQQNVGDINKATRVTGQNQDNLVDLATSQTRYEDHQNDMFAHQRHIARQAYIEYGRQGVSEQSAEPVITTADDVTDTSATQSYRAITGEDPSTSGQVRQAATQSSAASTPSTAATTKQGSEHIAIQQGTEPASTDSAVGTSKQAESETNKSQANSAQQRDKGIDGEELTEEEQAEVEEMKDRDAEVRTHENAHKSAGGQYAAAPSYTYETGPDGKRYITDGEVSIDIGEESDPQDTITKMQVVKRAALAPAQPSAQDRQVYAEASQKEAQARQELNEQKQEEAQGGSESKGQSGTNGAQGTNPEPGNQGATNGTNAAEGSSAAEGTRAQGVAPMSRTITQDENSSSLIPEDNSLNPSAAANPDNAAKGVNTQPTQGSGINAINQQAQRNVLDPAKVPEPSTSTTKKFSA
ncbi:MAG: putative metalloprotease CJM1_0395 family protein [Anaerobiospirillum sp.]|nr:putative metalloprotease CJM1_0395 family protein [Anaerobiospirillum sp.]